MKYTQPTGEADPNASYVDGNPNAGIRGSRVPAAAIEAPQREIQTCIVNSAQTPDPEDYTQLWDAIIWAINEYAGGGGGGGPYLPLAGGQMDSGANVDWHGGGVPTVNGLPVWHPQNDGDGSGLDADKLGGVDNANFVRNDRDLEFVGNNKFRFYRQTTVGNRGSFRIYGQDTQLAGGLIEFMAGDGSSVGVRVESAVNRRQLDFTMWSDGGSSTFEDQIRVLDVGDIWSRKLAGNIVDELLKGCKLIAWQPGVGANFNIDGSYRPSTYDGGKKHIAIAAWAMSGGGAPYIQLYAYAAGTITTPGQPGGTTGIDWIVWFETD